MDITEAKQIVSKYGRNSFMSILYNESPLKLINGKLTVNYLPSNIEDGSWSPKWESYIRDNKIEIIEYFKAREVIFEHSLAEYLRGHRAVLRPNSEKNKLKKLKKGGSRNSVKAI
jgi:hypothetical protein